MTVVERVDKPEHLKGCEKIYYRCLCDCNKEIISSNGNLKSGHTKSCGCYNIEKLKERRKYNKYDLTGDFGIGYTTKNEKFYFDKENYQLIKEYCWYIGINGYPTARINGKPRLMHRLIMNVLDDKDKVVDHIDTIRYNCLKENLRICTNQQNRHNVGITKRNKSGIIGVCWNNNREKWFAQIGIDGKNIYLGLYTNIEDAAQVRKEAEIKYFGEFRYKGVD